MHGQCPFAFTFKMEKSYKEIIFACFKLLKEMPHMGIL